MERIKYKNPKKLKGMVDEVFVTDGDSVTEGQALALISTQGEKYEIVSHLDGIVKSVYIIESLLVSHGDIIFDIYSLKDLTKIAKSREPLGDTMKYNLKKAGYLEETMDELHNSAVEDVDLNDEDNNNLEPEKEQTMRFNIVGDNNVENVHGDLSTSEHFDRTEEKSLFEKNETLSSVNDEIKEPLMPAFAIPETRIISNLEAKKEDEFLKRAVDSAIDETQRDLDLNIHDEFHETIDSTNVSDIKDDFDMNRIKNDDFNKDINFNVPKVEEIREEASLIFDNDDEDEAEDNLPVDISNEAMNESFEKQMSGNSFLHLFNSGNNSADLSGKRSEDTINEAKEEQVETKFTLFNHDDEMLQKSKEVEKEIETKNESSKNVELHSELEIGRIENLLDVAHLDLDIDNSNVDENWLLADKGDATLPPTITSDNIKKPEVKSLLNDDSGVLNLKIQNNAALIRELSRQIEDLKSTRSDKIVEGTVKTDIGSSMSEFTFETNATALLNLHSILNDAFMARDIVLKVGLFVNLAMTKTILQLGLKVKNIKAISVNDLQFEYKNIEIKKDLTILDMVSIKPNSVETFTDANVSIYDLTTTSIKSANIASNDLFTIVIGKIYEKSDLTGTLVTKIIFDKRKLSLNEALKIIYVFNGLIENPGFLI